MGNEIKGKWQQNDGRGDFYLKFNENFTIAEGWWNGLIFNGRLELRLKSVESVKTKNTKTEKADNQKLSSSQSIQGDGNVQVGGNVGGNITVNKPSKPVKKIVLNNNGNPTLVLKNIDSNASNPLNITIETSNHVGLAEVEVEVKILQEMTTKNPLINFTKVQILDGRLKGKIGWVSSNSIKFIEISR